ncbi:putative bifunctional diguanylate cyclase/phosphodiesterase [Silanimonas sp.]|jgi:diguanylate cyclase (GGDEF)-like protein|uniref:putative bifunctional diguanylate cyclase/phosphodiesterase n=1 Tax=Silanimonas sp. TaxID=1929290 RepID=UPI0037CAE30C
MTSAPRTNAPLSPVVSLQSRLVRAFLAIGAALVVVMAAITFGLIGRMVEAVEAKEAKRAWDRVASIERAKADLLRTVVDDYAYWNDMAAFVESGAPGFRRDTFDVWFLDNADTDGVLVLSPRGEVLVAGVAERAATGFGDAALPEPAFDGAMGLVALAPALVEQLRQLPKAAVVRDGGDSGITWIEHRGQWIQVAIGAVGYQGQPPNGGLVMILRAVDRERLAARAVESQVDYRIVAFDPDRLAIQAAEDAALLAVPIDDPILGTEVMAIARHPYELSGLLGQVQVVTVVQQTLLLGALLYLLIELLKRQVLVRIQALRREVEALRVGTIRRMDLPGPRDELTLLGEEFGAIYRTLDGARTEWRKAALRDPLTGLGNRAALQARLEVLMTAGRSWPASLHLLDLDGFKAINDVHGHATGDAMLVALSRSLAAKLGERAEVFRLGGDEYAILANHGDDIGREVLDAVAHVRVLDAAGHALRLRASLGRASLSTDLDSPGDWLRRADIAMYEAKRAGGSRLVDYVPSMREALVERESIERRLRRALDEGRIDVAFQPIVSAVDGRLTAVEALARWNDAERGRVPPSRFVPVAEEAGFSAELDLQVLAKALPALVALRRETPALVLQVNLAPPSLLSPGIVERIDGLVRAAGVPPEAMLLEVTESALAADPNAITGVIERLRSLGLRIALDDFGTGYSSMARLAELKPSALKIDGQFVRDHQGDGDRIIRSILGLAKAFGLHATAEFVETDAQREYLRALGCDALQGYGIAEPMPEEKLLAWVEARALSARP